MCSLKLDQYKSFYLEFAAKPAWQPLIHSMFCLRDRGELSAKAGTRFASAQPCLRLLCIDNESDDFKWQYRPPCTKAEKRSERFFGWTLGIKFNCQYHQVLQDLNESTRQQLGTTLQDQKNHFKLEDIECFLDLMAGSIYESWERSQARLVNTCNWFNASEISSVAELAKKQGVSARTLQRKMQQELGLPPKKWLNTQRLEDAAKELVLSNMSLLEYSHEHDFSDQAHFNRGFKNHVGLAPKQFRQLWQTPSVRFVQDSSPGSLLKFALLYS